MHCYSSLIIGAPGNDNKQTYKFAVILNYKGHTNFSYSFQNNLFCVDFKITQAICLYVIICVFTAHEHENSLLNIGISN